MTDRTYPGSTATTTVDLHYAISALLASGAVVEHINWNRVTQPSARLLASLAAQKDYADAAYWRISTKDGRSFEVSGLALIELARDEAGRRREEWQRTEDALQLAMFKYEDTPNYRPATS